MKTSVIVFPGSNRDGDVARAVAQASGAAPSRIWHTEHELPQGTDLVILPGGFSYGDYLRCGAIAARAHIMNAVRAHAARGGYVLGICNGFQILCESGLLPGVLMRNRDLHFICKPHPLKVEAARAPFMGGYKQGQVVQFVLAHGEGNYEADEETIDRLENEGRVALRYCTPEGVVNVQGNPNGSTNNIAGIYSEKFNVLGMMPHPENRVDPLVGGVDGRALFEGLR